MHTKGVRSVIDFIVIKNGNSKEKEMNVCAADVRCTDHCLIWAESQQTRDIKNRRGRKMCRRRIDAPEVKEKQREFREEMTKNTERFSELLGSMGTTENDTERDSAGDRIIEGWEQLLKNMATNVIGEELDNT